MADENKTLRFAGDFRLDIATIVSYRSDPDQQSQPLRLDIKNSLIALSVVEDIGMECVSGELTLTDNVDIRTLLPLTGMERLEFRFWTPGWGYNQKCEALEGITESFYIYKIDKIRPVGGTGRGQVYRLQFVSREAYRNGICRASKAFKGPVENAVYEIVKNTKYLDSRKRLFIEETSTNTKMVIPTEKPFDAIDMLANSAVSTKYKGGSFVFFETMEGFHFRSIESLMAIGGATARPVTRRFRRTQAAVRDSKGNRNIAEDMDMVAEYKFEDPINMMENINDGVLANRLITHDIFNKSFTTTDFDYHESFKDYYHTEHDYLGTKSKHKYLLPHTPFDNTRKALSEQPTSKIMYKSGTTRLHNEYESVPHTLSKQSAVSQRYQLMSNHLVLTVPGDTNLHAGQMINFEMPYMKPVGPGEKQEINPYFAGRYLILQLKHTVDQTSGQHDMVLRCVKDSVLNRLPIETNKDMVDLRGKTRDQVVNINKKDEEFIRAHQSSVMNSGPPR